MKVVRDFLCEEHGKDIKFVWIECVLRVQATACESGRMLLQAATLSASWASICAASLVIGPSSCSLVDTGGGSMI